MKILVGGQALKNLGSSRNTNDYDFLVHQPKENTFYTENDIDYLNAAKSDFFQEIWEMEQGNEQATPQSLFELKIYAFVQHCGNFRFQKADDCEYDIKFLVRHFETTEMKIIHKYITNG